MDDMKGKTAGFVFLAICLVLASLLLAGFIAPLTGGGLFAGALIILGGMSRGFRRTH
jgi:hypothetical protein